jgi:hypothetical protein
MVIEEKYINGPYPMNKISKTITVTSKCSEFSYLLICLTLINIISSLLLKHMPHWVKNQAYSMKQT